MVGLECFLRLSFWEIISLAALAGMVVASSFQTFNIAQKFALASQVPHFATIIVAEVLVRCSDHEKSAPPRRHFAWIVDSIRRLHSKIKDQGAYVQSLLSLQD